MNSAMERVSIPRHVFHKIGKYTIHGSYKIESLTKKKGADEHLLRFLQRFDEKHILDENSP